MNCNALSNYVIITRLIFSVSLSYRQPSRRHSIRILCKLCAMRQARGIAGIRKEWAQRCLRLPFLSCVFSLSMFYVWVLPYFPPMYKLQCTNYKSSIALQVHFSLFLSTPQFGHSPLQSSLHKICAGSANKIASFMIWSISISSPV